MNIRDVMRLGPVIPVLVIERVQDAVPLARALVAGGIRVLEVTLRTPAALAATALIAREVPQAVVGVGTITHPADLQAARDAGARFGVSPGLTAELLETIPQVGLPMLPGVMTPSEVMAARAAGFDALKLFPAAQAGGVGMLQALAGPYPDLLFCPTGGVRADRMGEYLALPNVACVGGSWLTPREAVAAGDWARITALAAQACSAARY